MLRVGFLLLLHRRRWSWFVVFWKLILRGGRAFFRTCGWLFAAFGTFPFGAEIKVDIKNAEPPPGLSQAHNTT